MVSCSPEENANSGGNPEPEPGSTTLNVSVTSTQVSSYQIISLSAAKDIFVDDTYIFPFGDSEVTLVKENSKTVKFVVPDLSPGEYDFTIKIGDQEAKIIFKLSNPVVEDLAGILKSELETPLVGMRDALQEIQARQANSAEVKELLNSAISLLSSYNQKYTGLSTNERTEIAKFLKVNPIFSSNISRSSSNKSKTSSEINCYTENASYLAETSQTIEAWTELSNVLLNSEAKGYEAAGVSTAIGVYMASTLFLASRELLISHCKRPVSAHLAGDNNETESLEAINNTFRSWNLKEGRRGIIASDINSPLAVISGTILEINKISQLWIEHSKLNESFSKSSSWLNTWLESNIGYRGFPQSIPSLPNSTNKEFVVGETSNVEIVGLPTGVSVEVLKEEMGKLKMKFNASSNSLPRDISGKIKYQSADFEFESPFQMKLSELNVYKIQFGDYKDNYSLITPYLEVSEGDPVILGNGMFHMIRIILNGEPVIHPAYPENYGWGQWDFGSVPFKAQDVLVEDYNVNFTGPDGKQVEFLIDLTYSNMAYRTIVGKKVIVERISNGVSGGIHHITFHPNNIYVVQNANLEYVDEGPYSFFPGLETFETCPSYIGNRRQNGTIRIEGTPMTGPYPLVPPYIGIYPDNSLRYGCIDDPQNQWKIVL